MNITATNIGLGNVDNTSDANKPISNATQAALNDKQAKITASGLLKGDGAGGVSAAEAGTDYVASPEVFVATYGSTTFAEIKAAYDAGKVCLCKNGSEIKQLVTLKGSILALFSGVKNTSTLTLWTITNDDTWSEDVKNGYTPESHASTHASDGADPITPDDIGAVPTSRTVNGKALGANITLNAGDVSALPSSTTYVSTVDGSSGAITTNAVKYTSQSLTDAQKTQARTNIGAGTSSFSGSYNDLTNKPTIPSDYVPTSRTVNGKALSSNVTLSASDVNASSKSTIVSATLSASSWSGDSAPYTYTLSVSGVTANSNQELLPALNITKEQLTALQAANIQDGGQAANRVILTAFGDKPTIDLPIRVILRGDS